MIDFPDASELYRTSEDAKTKAKSAIDIEAMIYTPLLAQVLRLAASKQETRVELPWTFFGWKMENYHSHSNERYALSKYLLARGISMGDYFGQPVIVFWW